jgi:hypothetical protein
MGLNSIKIKTNNLFQQPRPGIGFKSTKMNSKDFLTSPKEMEQKTP